MGTWVNLTRWRSPFVISIVAVALLGGNWASRGSAQEATPGTDEAANKVLVLAFYQAFGEAIATGDMSGIDRIVSPSYVQHQQGVPPGRDGLKQFLTTSARAGRTGLETTIEQLVAEEDLVVAHTVSRRAGTDVVVRETMDIFRVANGQLVEHWGVVSGGGPPGSGSGTPAATPTG